jgi:hypothetical protein
MDEAQHDEVRGLRAAAKLTGRSPSGLQKMVDNGDLPAAKVDGVYVFDLSDLQALRPAPAPEPSGEAPADLSPDVPASEQAMAPSPAPVDPAEPRPAPEPPFASDGDVASMVFADLKAGKDLRTIVVERRLPPNIVKHWHDQWRELAEIDTLKTPAGERRLFTVERTLEIHEQCHDDLLEEIRDVRMRVRAIERVLGIKAEVSG